MAGRLNRSRIDQMWTVYQDRQSVQEVSKICRVHRATVERYRQLERWDERIAAVRAEAQAEADYTLARAMADSLKLVRSYKDRLARALNSKRVSASDVTAAELERVIKLEAYTLGGVESRTEVVGSFSDWTEEELEEYASTGKLPRGSRRRSA